MHKHVGEELVDLEIRRQEEVQAEDIVEVDTLHPEHIIGGECQNVYYQKVFGDSGYAAHNNGLLVVKTSAKLLKISVIPHKIKAIPIFFQYFAYFFLVFVCFMK